MILAILTTMMVTLALLLVVMVTAAANDAQARKEMHRNDPGAD